MRTGSKIIISLVTAGLTFGSLTAIMGPGKLSERWTPRHHYHKYHDHHCPDQENGNGIENDMQDS